jgi:oligopeptide/dipeptide ABC transporter ATP-binding protein
MAGIHTTARVAPPARGTRRPRRLSVADAVPLLLVLFFVFLSIAAPTIWGHDAAATNVADSDQGANAAHWMGTDDLGRDILARTLVATRASLVLAVLATLVGGVVGVILGLLSSVSRRVGRLLGALINLLIAFPALLLAIFFAVLFGIGSVGSVLAVGAAFAPGFARITQTLTASIVSKEYVEASRVLGKSQTYIIVRHIVPNIAEPLILYATIHLGTAILSLSGLSFLGLGVQPPSYDWGRLLNDGLGRVYVSPIVAVAPSVAIVLAGLAFNMAGERLSDIIGGRRVAPPAPRPTAPRTASALDVDDAPDALVKVRHLRIGYARRGATPTTPVRDVSFTIAPNEKVGIVGESGSGKSLTAFAVARLIEDPATVEAETLRFLDIDLLAGAESGKHALATMNATLGRNMAMVFQDPGEALNPAIKIGTHLIEPAVLHLHEPKKTAKAHAIDALRSVAIPQPARRYKQHQHELSGGMKQRVCIAIGLMGEPRLLIADEPTTALDVTVQRQILRTINDVGAQTEAGILFISHDIAVVSELCDRILVMYAGFIVEEAATADLITAPAHPYSSVLLAASPNMSIDKTEQLTTIDGRMPGPDVDLPGCYFASRCQRADATCVDRRPPLAEMGAGHKAACWHPLTEPAAPPVAGQRTGEPNETAPKAVAGR